MIKSGKEAAILELLLQPMHHMADDGHLRWQASLKCNVNCFMFFPIGNIKNIFLQYMDIPLQLHILTLLVKQLGRRLCFLIKK